MRIASELLDEIVAHALEDPAIECCGVVAVEVGEDGTKTAAHVYRTHNVHESALKFQIDPLEQLKINEAIDDQGWDFGAIYHSHVRSEPKPSQTDITFAAGLPGVEWVIVGVANRDAPEVRSYLIDGGNVEEVPIEEPAS
ncbi:MAG TPA: M67 family metallopeptidase [Solirubrobacteraceae bacterium]|jgi:proteasome lid subunit RPN8/RPN11|nr:M67 family metallopeptidase [Solirubrobacteraceae bacterium]